LLRKQRKTLGGYFILPHLVVLLMLLVTSGIVRTTSWSGMVWHPGISLI